MTGSPIIDRRALIGAMFADGEKLWEVIGYDGTDPRGGAAWIVADARHDLSLSPRDRPSRRVTQNELDRMERVGFGSIAPPESRPSEDRP